MPIETNQELQQKYIDSKVMFLQRVCEKHEWVEVTTSGTGINKPITAWQCRLCGKCKSDSPNS